MERFAAFGASGLCSLFLLVATCGLVSMGLVACDDDEGEEATPVADPDPPDPPESPSTSRYLAIPCVPQQTQVWCWAATTEMAVRWRTGGAAPAQCRILTDFLLCDCCSFPQFCPQTCLVAAPSTQTIQNAIQFYTGAAPPITPPLTFQGIVDQIDADRAIIAAYEGSFTGHVVVIYGYDAVAGTVAICDPFFGNFPSVPYGTSFNYNGSLLWTQSIVGI